MDRAKVGRPQGAAAAGASPHPTENGVSRSRSCIH